MSRGKAPYSAQFREQMVELVRAGRKPRELAQEFGCHCSSILSWVRSCGGVTLPAADVSALNASERTELIELRRRVRQIQTERDILAKAMAWFATKSEKTSTSSSNS
jgi:transposase